MLATIGVAGIEDLFDEIPADLRVKSLAGVPPELNEMQIGRLMTERARADGAPLAFIGAGEGERRAVGTRALDRKSTRLNSSHSQISYAVFCLQKRRQSDPS